MNPKFFEKLACKKLKRIIVGLMLLFVVGATARAEPRLVSAIFCDSKAQITKMFQRLEFERQSVREALDAINGAQKPVRCFKAPVPIMFDAFKLEETMTRRSGRTVYIYSGLAIGYAAKGAYFTFKKSSRHYFIAFEPIEKGHEATFT